MDKSLYGQPLSAALEQLKNTQYRVVQYASPRGPLGEDVRVLRVREKDGMLELVVSGFCTTVNGENIGNQ